MLQNTRVYCNVRTVKEPELYETIVKAINEMLGKNEYSGVAEPPCPLI